MSKYAFGVDIGGTTIKIGLFEPDGKVIEKWEIPTNKNEQSRYILSEVAAEIKNTIKKKNLNREDLLAVGVGVPGPVLEGQIVNVCVNLGWTQKNVATELSALLDGAIVRIGNDANVAALGEQWMGGGKGYSNSVMITLGTGVGGGIILNSKIIEGAHGAGGEIGHIHMIDDEKDACGCGNHGCLEQYASAPGIVRMTKKKLSACNTSSSLRNIQDLTCKDVFDAAKSNDAIACEIVDETAHMLGTACAHIACIVDPDVFVFGGGVSKAGNILIDAIRKHYVPLTFQACRQAELTLATLGNDAGIYGAVKLAIDYINQN